MLALANTANNMLFKIDKDAYTNRIYKNRYLAECLLAPKQITPFLGSRIRHKSISFKSQTHSSYNRRDPRLGREEERRE